MILPADPVVVHLAPLFAPIASVVMGWAIAIPLMTAIFSAAVQINESRKSSKPVSNTGVRENSDQYFPGLFSKKGEWNASAMANPIQTRATGGPIQPGTPYLVGERGPEVVQPTAPGTVIPNASTSQATSQSPAQPQTTPTTPTARQAMGGLPVPPAEAGPTLPTSRTPETAPTDPSAPAGAPTAPAAAPASTGSFIPTSQTGTAGDMAVNTMLSYFGNPGQISPAAYERKQEQINQGYGQAVRGVGGTLSSVGVDPNSGYGQILGQSAALNAMKMRNEANRDFTMASEQMRREDLKMATDTYLRFLDTLFSIGQAQSAGAMAQNKGMSGVYTGIATAGQTLGDYFAKNDNQTSAQTEKTTAAYGTPLGSGTGEDS